MDIHVIRVIRGKKLMENWLKKYFRIFLIVSAVLAVGSPVFAQFAQGRRSRRTTKSRTVEKITPQPCEVAGAEPNTRVSVLCAQLEVPEDRSLKDGRKIAIKIVIFPAAGKDKVPDPLFYIPGGPGSSATEDAPYVAQEFAKVREHRDLVFVDQRGTGGSNPLNCTFFNKADLQSYLGHWNPPDEVRRWAPGRPASTSR